MERRRRQKVEEKQENKDEEEEEEDSGSCAILGQTSVRRKPGWWHALLWTSNQT